MLRSASILLLAAAACGASDNLNKNARRQTPTPTGGNNQAPVAIIDAPTTSAEGATLHFDGSASHDPDGLIDSFAWEFSDGTTSTSFEVDKVVNVAGVFTATLTVTDDAGAADDAQHSVTVTAPLPTSYDGSWTWGLVNPADAPDSNCGTFYASTLTIATATSTITLTESTGLSSVTYDGSLTGTTFSATADLSLGLGSQTIAGTFTTPTHFEGTYSVVASVLSCNRTRQVFGDKQ